MIDLGNWADETYNIEGECLFGDTEEES